jgi:hypothetical protein
MLTLVLSETFKGVQATETNGGVGMSELLDGLAVQLSDPSLGCVINVVPSDRFRMRLRGPCHIFGVRLRTLTQPLATNREQQRYGSPGSRSDAETDLDRLDTQRRDIARDRQQPHRRDRSGHSNSD